MGFHPSGSGGGATAFTGLSDVPGSYTSQSLRDVRVNASETALEFYDASTSGDFVGPSSSTDNAVVRYDGVTGKLSQNSVVLIGDTGAITGVLSIAMGNTGLLLADTDASHFLNIVPGSNITANRTLSLVTGDADRSLTLGGNVSFAAGFSTSGANSLTFTTTAPTSLTLPTSGTVATTSNKLSDFAAPTASVSMNSQLITNLATPVSAADAATKAYADAIATGLLVKTSCRLASTANFSSTYLAGVLTAVGFGAITVDSVTPSVNDRILLKDQTDGKQNGIYTVTVVGNGGTAAVLTRATDFDTSGEVLSGSYTFITAGSANIATGFILTTAATITLDTTSLSFTQFSAATNYVAGAGLALSGLTFSIGADSGITVSSDSIGVDFTAVQAKSTVLTTIAAFNTNGLFTQTGPGSFTGRTITAGSGVAVTNGNGVSGNPTIDVSITSLTEDTNPDTSADYVMSYDVSATANKKVLLRGLQSGSSTYQQIGTTPVECWYSNQVSAAPATVTTAASTPVDTLRAFPFFVSSASSLDRLAFVVSTLAAAGVGRVGIYTTTSTTNLYPSTLVIESGELSTASIGAKVATISANLQSGSLYYFVFLFGVAAPILRAAQTYAVSGALGWPSSLVATPNIGFTTPLAYQALPTTFPAGATLLVSSATNPYLGYYRRSA
jgi:hypothetical protein